MGIWIPRLNNERDIGNVRYIPKIFNLMILNQIRSEVDLILRKNWLKKWLSDKQIDIRTNTDDSVNTGRITI